LQDEKVVEEEEGAALQPLSAETLAAKHTRHALKRRTESINRPPQKVRYLRLIDFCITQL